MINYRKFNPENDLHLLEDFLSDRYSESRTELSWLPARLHDLIYRVSMLEADEEDPVSMDFFYLGEEEGKLVSCILPDGENVYMSIAPGYEAHFPALLSFSEKNCLPLFHRAEDGSVKFWFALSNRLTAYQEILKDRGYEKYAENEYENVIFPQETDFSVSVPTGFKCCFGDEYADEENKWTGLRPGFRVEDSTGYWYKTFPADETSSEKFPYGLDVQVYLEKAVERIKEKNHYHWADLSKFHKQYRYAIEEADGEYHFVRYTMFSEDDIEREVLDEKPANSWNLVRNGEEFIESIAIDNESSVYYANPKIENYKVSFTPGLEVDHWYIERYEFNKHQTGDYSAFVQAGDRTTGASRDFFIPPQFLGGTFEEFLNQYETLVPGNQFGLYKENLMKDEGLKKFLGFSV